MKKLFLGVLAIATMVACAKEDVISQNNEAIGFKQAFVDNSVRSVVDPSISKDNLANYDFSVYAFVEKSPLLTNEKVYDAGNAWTYDATQYWIYGANYNFCAIAPNLNASWTVNNTKVSDAYNATFTIGFTNDGTEDLLFANAGKIQGQEAGSNNPVGFTFGHLLSKVKFSFENGYNASNATIKVSNIHITNAHESATASVTARADGTYLVVWGALPTTGVLDLDFGKATDYSATTDVKEAAEVDYGFGGIYESHKELLLIPSPIYKYNVTFHVDLLVSGAEVNGGYTHNVPVEFGPEAGKSYNIKAVINAKNIDPDHQQDPIVFTVTDVDEWTPASPNPELPGYEIPQDN